MNVQYRSAGKWNILFGIPYGIFCFGLMSFLCETFFVNPEANINLHYAVVGVLLTISLIPAIWIVIAGIVMLVGKREGDRDALYGIHAFFKLGGGGACLFWLYSCFTSGYLLENIWYMLSAVYAAGLFLLFVISFIKDIKAFLSKKKIAKNA